VNGSFTDTGLTNTQTYWYQARAIWNTTIKSGWSSIEYATPKTDLIRPWGSILINNGENETRSSTVTVHLLAAEDTVLMRVGLDPSFTNASWEPMAENKTIILDSIEEIQYVYAQFQDAAGNIGAFDGQADYTFDGIYLNLPAISTTTIIWIGGIGFAGLAILSLRFHKKKGSQSKTKK
jgi:hypothetical protein